jgi:integrase
MLEEGVHPKVAQDILGHSTYTLTMNNYNHVAPSMQQHATDKLDKIFPLEGVRTS